MALVLAMPAVRSFLTCPERSIPSFQKRLHLSGQPRFLVGGAGDRPGGGDIIGTLGDEAEDRGGVFLQVLLSLRCGCISEDLPVRALKPVLELPGHTVTVFFIGQIRPSRGRYAGASRMEVWSERPR